MNYAEAIIFLDNDSTMRVAACEDCVGLVNDIVGGDDIRANIVANHKAYWSNEIDKDNRISAKEKVIRKARLDKVDGIFIGKNKKTINNLIKHRCSGYQGRTLTEQPGIFSSGFQQVCYHGLAQVVAQRNQRVLFLEHDQEPCC